MRQGHIEEIVGERSVGRYASHAIDRLREVVVLKGDACQLARVCGVGVVVGHPEGAGRAVIAENKERVGDGCHGL